MNFFFLVSLAIAAPVLSLNAANVATRGALQNVKAPARPFLAPAATVPRNVVARSGADAIVHAHPPASLILNKTPAGVDKALKDADLLMALVQARVQADKVEKGLASGQAAQQVAKVVKDAE